MVDPIISHEVRLVLELKERLQAGFDLDDDDLALWDTIEGETTLKERLVAILRKAAECDAFEDALGEMINKMQTRKQRMKNKSEKLRNLVAWAMSECGMKKIDAADLTVTLAKGRPPLLITNEVAAAEQFRLERKPEVDRTKLRQFLESGQRLWYATLGNPSNHLTIRTK